MVRIEINSGSEAGKVVELKPGTHVVGRQPSSDFCLAVESVSGRHLELVVAADGSVRFKDLGSTNGTFSGGVKVTEGEWFPGSELRLGKASLRLIDENAVVAEAAVADEDAAMHARAREAAMSGGRRGGPLMMLGLVVLVAGAGAAYWFLGRGEEPTAAGGTTGGANPDSAAAAVARDWIDDLGQFAEEDAGVWAIGEGLTIEAGTLRSTQGGRRASLTREFAAAPELQITAEVQGGTVHPLVEWGEDGQESGITWRGAALGNGPVSLRLPEDAAWIRFSLSFTTAASVRALQVEAGEAAALDFSSHESRSWVSSAANLLLRHSDGRAILAARGGTGSWSSSAGGLDFQAGSGSVGFRTQQALAATPVLILSDGGPVPAADGVRIDASPGLVFGEGALRLVMRFGRAGAVTVRDGVVHCQEIDSAQLRWDITEDLTQASRLERQLKNAASDADVAGVLAAAGEILRDYPLDPETVGEALARSREVLQEGRAALATLARERADAEFLQSIPDLIALETEARQLATAYSGTDLAAQATAEAEALEQSAAFLREARAARAATYRARLTTALGDAYPLLADWLRAEGQS